MGRCYKYAVAQFPADAVRNERLNVAIVVFNDQSLEVKIPRSLDKLRAISAAIDLDLVRDFLSSLRDLDAYVRSQGILDTNERVRLLQEIAPVTFSPLGEFFAPNDYLFESTLSRLLLKLVEPEPAPARLIRRRPTRLLVDIKSAFKAERVLARKGEGLDAHRIVTNHKVAEGLAADLVLKNGAMHVIQTADSSADDASPRRTIMSIAISALIFEQARMSFGESNTRPRLVYKASSAVEGSITPSLDAAEHQGATLINWESRDDRNRFIIELSSLADPLSKSRTSTGLQIHASAQPRLKLN